MLIMTNAFSLNMLDYGEPQTFAGEAYRTGFGLYVRQISREEAREALASDAWASAIGHEGTAHVVSQQLGVTVPLARASVLLGRYDCLLVCQAQMPRLAEGQVLTAEEMADIPIRFIVVRRQTAAEYREGLANVTDGDFPYQETEGAR